MKRFSIMQEYGKLITVVMLLMCCDHAFAQNSFDPEPSSTIVDSNALLLPQFSIPPGASGGGLFGRSVNSVAHQTTPLLTRGDFQYAAWYRLGNVNEDVIFGRRNLTSGSGWETFDTGLNMIRGDANDEQKSNSTPTQTQPWDNHNAVNMGMSGDGRLHIAFDHHSNTLRYIQSVTNIETRNWNREGVFGDGVNTVPEVQNLEQDNFQPGAPTLVAVTYPRFVSNPVTGDMVATYRLGQSGAGDLFIRNYDSASGTWGNQREFITGNDGIAFNDSVRTGITNTSTSRNPYLNNISYGPDGRLHASFTWRETANGTANHDINYITSTDNGMTWLNDSDDLVAGVNQAVGINTPGIIIDSSTNFIVPGIPGGASFNSNLPLGVIDRRQTLMNQQGQTVDQAGGVHVLMWHREDPATYDSGDSPFDTQEAAHFHYFKNPVTGDWSKNQVPLVDDMGLRVEVSSRPQIVAAANGDVFAAYVSPGVADDNNRNFYDNGFLVIAGATKAANYQDWSILYQDRTMIFEGEPIVDQSRLLSDGVLSVLLQEHNPNDLGVTTSSLWVLDFQVFDPQVIFPTTEITIFRGVNIEGGLAESQDSDNEFTRYQPGFTLNSSEAPVWLVYESEVPSGIYELDVEARANTPGLSREVELWNFQTGSYDLVGVAPELFNEDSVSSHPLVAENFNGEEVRARVGWSQTGFTLLFPWEIRVDQVAWIRQ